MRGELETKLTNECVSMWVNWLLSRVSPCFCFMTAGRGPSRPLEPWVQEEVAIEDGWPKVRWNLILDVAHRDIYRTGLQVTYVFLGGHLVPTGIVLVICSLDFCQKKKRKNQHNKQNNTTLTVQLSIWKVSKWEIIGLCQTLFWMWVGSGMRSRQRYNSGW